MAREPDKEFTTQIKMQALERQDFLCGSCGLLIVPFGGSKMTSVAWGESAHAHHRKPVRMGGGGNIENCVILCESCHYNAHEGGRYVKGTAWGRISDFEYFYGTK
jgi:5-methylcytosine-specific restriction endonuclease McrA